MAQYSQEGMVALGENCKRIKRANGEGRRAKVSTGDGASFSLQPSPFALQFRPSKRRPIAPQVDESTPLPVLPPSLVPYFRSRSSARGSAPRFPAPSPPRRARPDSGGVIRGVASSQPSH